MWIKKLLLICTLFLAMDPIHANKPVDYSLLKDLWEQEFAPFKTSPIISTAVFATGTLWTAIGLYYGINWWKKRQEKEPLDSPISLISPAIIVGYIVMKLYHHAIAPASGWLKMSYDMVHIYKEFKNTGKEIIKTILNQSFIHEKIEFIMTQRVDPIQMAADMGF